MVIFKGTNFYPRQIESLILKCPGLGPEYRIELDREAGGDRLAIVVEACPDVHVLEAQRLEREIRAQLNLTAEVRLLKQGEIPRAPGKAVRVVDRRHASA
jgi:phenylacetate-CoA ligase